MKVRTKLFVGFSVFVVLLLAVGLLAWSLFGSLKDRFSTIEEDIVPDTLAMTELEILSSQIYQDVTDYLYHDMEDAKEQALLKLERLQEIRLEYLPTAVAAGATEHWKDPELADQIYNFYRSIGMIINLKERAADYDTLLVYDRNIMLPPLLAMQERAQELRAASVASLASIKESFDKAHTSGLNAIYISALLIAFAAIGAGILVTRSIVRPLFALRKGTEMIAQGNLDYKVGTGARDEIGELSRAFDKMTESLSTSMTSIDNLNQEIDERKRAEEALKESEEFASSLLENAPHAIVVINPDTSIKYVNPTWEKLNGWTLSEIAGMEAPYPWWPDEFKETFTEGFKEAMAQGSGNGEIIAQKKNGEIYWIDMNWASVMHNGKRRYLVINSVDITERKKAEEELRSNEERFRLLAENSNDLIFRIQITPTTKTDYVSPSCLRITGYKQEEFYNNPELGQDIVHPEDRESFLKQVSPENKSNHTPFTVRLVRKDGRVIWVELTHTIIYNDRGKAAAMHVVAHDITAHKENEAALKESEERFSKAFNASTSIKAITTLKDGRYIEVNEGFTRATGYSREEVIGRTTQEIDIWANPEDRADMLRKMKKQGRIHSEEYQFRVKSGEIRTMLFSAEKINLGSEPCILGVCVDITGRKKAARLQNDENHVLTLLGQGAKLSELLDAIVSLGESYDPDIKGALMLYNASEQKLYQAAAPNLPASYNKLLENGLPVGPNIGSCGTAAYLKERVIVPDIMNSPLFPDKEGAAGMIKEGLRACWSQPVIGSDGELLGTIANYKTRAGEPSEDNLNVLEWSARIAAIAIEHKRAEEALAEEAIRRRILVDESLDGIVVLDEDSKVYEANQRFCEMLGYTPEEVLELHTWDWDKEFTPEELLKMGQNVGPEGLHIETQHQRKDGTFIDVDISVNGAVAAGKKFIFCVCRDVTARKQAEQALHESEERFSKAFNASPGSMSISRLKDGVFIEVNDAFLKDKGFTRDEVIGHSSTELGIWENDKHRREILQLMKTEGRVRNHLTHFHTKTGELRTGHLSAEYITLANEPCMIILTTDITKLKQAEEQLRLLGSVTQQVSDSTIVIDTRFKITYMNQAAEALFGYTLEEARGNTLDLFDANPLTRKEMGIIKKTITSGKVYKSIHYKKRKDGSLLICDCCLSPLYDENGEICSYIDVQRDITKQKEVEAKLQVHKQLIERILATMPEGMLVIGRDDRILLANEAFQKIFHTGKKPISDRPLDAVIPVKPLLNLYKEVKRGSEESNTLEFRYDVKGLEKRIDSVITKMDEERTLLTFADVSQEREEEEKLYLTDRLASIGEMAAGLAHELNNPLTGVLALSQLLMDSEIPEEYREDLECVYSEAKRAASIVKNVLLFARNNNYENGHASANDVIRDVLRLREYEEKVSNIKAVMNLQKDLPEVPIDKFQLQQVFLNLILNAEAAIKETSKPGTLTVTTERVNNHINVRFEDNGCGIDRHVLPRIFDPFFTTKDIGKGTGLGLSICYGIIMKYGGKISVKTNVNKGSTFTVKMPVASPTE